MSLSLIVLRKQAGRTQQEMADLFGIDIRTWRKWEKHPDDMPYGNHQQAIDFLERSVQIRKAIRMKDYGNPGIEAIHADEAQEDNYSEYTVDIPKNASPTFKPNKWVSPQQMLDWELKGKEPYEGFADEYEAWELACDELNMRQMEADGTPMNVQDVVHADPEFNEETSEPIVYAGEPMIVVHDNGDLSAYDTSSIEEDDGETK